MRSIVDKKYEPDIAIFVLAIMTQGFCYLASVSLTCGDVQNFGFIRLASHEGALAAILHVTGTKLRGYVSTHFMQVNALHCASAMCHFFKPRHGKTHILPMLHVKQYVLNASDSRVCMER